MSKPGFMFYPMVPFEIDEENGTINPIWVPNDPSKPRPIPPKVTVSSPKRPDYCVIALSQFSMVCISICLGAFFCCAGIFGISFAREFNAYAGSNYIESIFTLSVIESMFLPALFGIGILVLISFKATGGEQINKHEKRYAIRSFVLIIVITSIALIAMGPIPAAKIKVGKEIDRGSCKMYAQGYAMSESLLMFKQFRETCPGLARENYFFAVESELLKTLNGDHDSLFRMLKLINQAMTIADIHFFTKQEQAQEVVHLLCGMVFLRCNRHNCQKLERCNIFSEDWYNVSHQTRIELKEKLVDNDVSPMDELYSTVEDYTNDKLLIEIAGILLSLFQSNTAVISREWEFPPSIKDGLSRKQNVSVYTEIDRCDPNLDNSKNGKWIANPSFENSKKVREGIILMPVVIMMILLIFCSWRNIIVFKSYYSWKTKLVACYSIGGIAVILIIILSLGALVMYGGSLLAKVPGHSLYAIAQSPKCFLPFSYFMIGLFIFYGFGFFISRKKTKINVSDGTDPPKVRSFMRRLHKLYRDLLHHRLVQYVRECNDPELPEYVYRVLFMEGMEVCLQIGAMLSPQLLNGDVVLMTAILVAVNVCAMAGIMYFFEPSPARMRIILFTEIIFDMYFAGYGIVRLKSNTNLSLIEHLALIKPVVSLNLDLYDFYVVLNLNEYNHSISHMPAKLEGFVSQKNLALDSRKPVKGNQKSKRFLLYFFMPVLTIAFCLVAIAKYVAIEKECVAEVGPISLCASERFYFNIPGGIMGKPSCAFADVKSLACSKANVHYLPDRIGSLMPKLKNVFLSHNPQLESIPESLASIASLRILDVSYTGVRHIPFEVAVSLHIQELIVTDAPIATSIDWSNKGIVALPPVESTFYRSFGATLEYFQLSGNFLNHTTPGYEDFCKFEKLKYLNLSGNQFLLLNSIAEDFSKCTLTADLSTLNELDLSRNRISEFIVTSKAVESNINNGLRIYLTENPIVKIRFKSLNNKAAETKMYFSNLVLPLNPVVETIKFETSVMQNFSAFLPWPKCLRNSKTFDAYGSFLTLTLDPFTELNSLTTLKLDASVVTGTLKPLENLSKLEELDLPYCLRIDGTLKPLLNLVMLRHVHLGNNNLTGSLPKEIGRLSKLTYLNLANNQLAGALPIGIGKLSQLKSLFLQSNNLNDTQSRLEDIVENLTKLIKCNLGMSYTKQAYPNTNTTINGLTCQKWTADIPHEHGYEYLGDHNYCRDADEPHVWCYTTDPSTRWEYCNHEVLPASRSPCAWDVYS